MAPVAAWKMSTMTVIIRTRSATETSISMSVKPRRGVLGLGFRERMAVIPRFGFLAGPRHGGPWEDGTSARVEGLGEHVDDPGRDERGVDVDRHPGRGQGRQRLQRRGHPDGHLTIRSIGRVAG